MKLMWGTAKERIFPKVHKTSEFVKSKMPAKMTKKWWVLLIVAVVLILILLIVGIVSGKKTSDAAVLTATADVGNIEVIISGTGMIEPNASYEVTSLVKGEIINAPFEEGSEVQKGDLLYQIDTADIENTIERSKISLERAQNTYNQNQTDLMNLNVRSTGKGTITALYVKKGDNVSQNTKIADVVDAKAMVLKVPFISEHAQQISVGETAEVTLQSGGGILWGTVTKVSTGEIIADSGVIVKNVEIEVENPGNLKEGEKATALVGDVSCNDVGTLSYCNVTTVVAEVSGKVDAIYCKEGDYVDYGTVILHLSSSSVEQNYKSSTLSLRESQLSLDSQYDQMDNYNITSPINGTVIQKNSKQGDTLDNTNSTTVMATIADLSKILFQMSVDELDISKIEVGQTVQITADALEDKVFTGYVETVSIIGTSSNGVTTYPVTIVVNEPEGLIPGMNVSADIIVEKKENVVRIPASALKRGNLVAVQLKDGEKAPELELPDGTKAPKNSKMMPNMAPDGFKLVPVKIGLSNEDYVEILEGISPGDVVQVTSAELVTSSNPFAGMGGMPGGMSGGISGGMPNRGMPAGGMSGGR